MAELSPAARTVQDAVLALYQEGPARDSAWPLERPMVTAVLRALADEAKSAKHWHVNEILAIANELESTND